MQQHLVGITAIHGNFCFGILSSISWFTIDWFLFVFTDFLWGNGNWMFSAQKFVSQNSFDEGYSFDNLELTRSSNITIFQDSRTKWSTIKYAN